MTEEQENIVNKADKISQVYYSIIRGLKGDERDKVTKIWMNELSVLRVMYDALREE